MDLLPVKYAVLLTQKSDIDLGFASGQYLIFGSITQLIIYFQFHPLVFLQKVCGQYHTILPGNIYCPQADVTILDERRIDCDVTIIYVYFDVAFNLLSNYYVNHYLNCSWFLFLQSTKSITIVTNKVIVSFYTKLKVYNKKVIDFVWENMMTLFFVADGPRTRQKTRSSYFPIKSL